MLPKWNRGLHPQNTGDRYTDQWLMKSDTRSEDRQSTATVRQKHWRTYGNVSVHRQAQFAKQPLEVSRKVSCVYFSFALFRGKKVKLQQKNSCFCRSSRRHVNYRWSITDHRRVSVNRQVKSTFEWGSLTVTLRGAVVTLSWRKHSCCRRKDSGTKWNSYIVVDWNLYCISNYIYCISNCI